MLLRVLTALVGVPLLVSAVWWGAPWLTLLVLLVAVLGISEIYRLLPPDIGRLPLALGALWCASLVLGAQASSNLNNFLLISGGIWVVGAFLAILWLIAFYRGRRFLIALIYLAGGPLYVGFLLAHAVALRELGSFDELGLEAGREVGRNWLLFALLVTFATDTGAYFTGRSLGRRPMAPRLSPSKTWEGAAGGLFSGLLGALILGIFLDLYLTGWKVAVIGATVAVVCQWGDLFESKLKRIADEKDSGSIIPGHGGGLDRLDSILISVPAVYYLVSTVFSP